MGLLHRFCNSIIDASDAFGASVAGVDVKSFRAHTYGHPDGIAAARASAHTLPCSPVHAEAVDLDDDDLDVGMFGTAPRSVALDSTNPTVRAHMDDLDEVLEHDPVLANGLD